MPLNNKLQAVETILDSESQKSLPDRRALTLALKIVRAAQRELFGQRYVKEWSLVRHFHRRDYERLSKKNWTKWQKETSKRALAKLEAA